MIRLSIFFLALIGACSPLDAPSDAQNEANDNLRERAAAAYGGDRPGASVIVYRDGEILLHEAFGMANLELDVPLSTNHRFRIASVTKQFTGAAVASLVEDGILDLDTDIRTYLPDFEDKGQIITLRHLLHHTSGLYNYTNNDDYEPLESTDISLQETRLYYEKAPLDFPPGSNWSYSNSGYALTSLIIETVTKREFEDVVAERLFVPAGMTGTQFQLRGSVMEASPSQYWRNEDNYYPAQRAGLSGHGDGEIYSTTGDLLRWYEALRDGDVLSAQARETLYASAVLPDGRDTRYGMGLFHGRIGEFATYEHGGNVGGWRAYMIMIPEADAFVAILANSTDQNESLVAADLIKAALGVDANEIVALDLNESSLEKFSGVYRHGPDDRRVIRIKGAKLQSRRGEGAWYNLIAIGENHFMFEDDPDTRIIFDDQGLRVTYRYGMDHLAIRVTE